MIPLPVSTHPVGSIQQRSVVQRRTPPRKLEGENLTDSDLEQRLNRGLIVEQRGLEEGGWRIGLGDKLCCAPPPLPSLYRWPGDPWGAIRGVGSPTWTPKPPKPSHRKPAILESWTSHLEGDSFPLVRPHPLAGQGSLGGLPPKSRGVG